MSAHADAKTACVRTDAGEAVCDHWVINGMVKKTLTIDWKNGKRSTISNLNPKITSSKNRSFGFDGHHRKLKFSPFRTT
jgi:hypothetical protein